MNTARADFDDKNKFLNTFRNQNVDIDDIHVHRAGNIEGDEIPAVKKVKIIKRQLQINFLLGVRSVTTITIMYIEGTTEREDGR